MSLSLKELRTQPLKGKRPERAVNICLAPDLVSEVQRVSNELDDLESEVQTPRRMNQPKTNPRATELRTRLAELLDEMSEYTGMLTVRAALTDGEWRQWTNEHPARTEDEPGYERDQRTTGLVCNADDLLDELASYVFAWNDDILEPGDYEQVFEPVIATADKLDIARHIIQMYESRLDFPRWRSNLFATLERSSESVLPEISESPTSGSTEAPPDPSLVDTAKTGSKSRSPRLGKP